MKILEILQSVLRFFLNIESISIQSFFKDLSTMLCFYAAIYLISFLCFDRPEVSSFHSTKAPEVCNFVYMQVFELLKLPHRCLEVESLPVDCVCVSSFDLCILQRQH